MVMAMMHIVTIVNGKYKKLLFLNYFFSFHNLTVSGLRPVLFNDLIYSGAPKGPKKVVHSYPDNPTLKFKP